MKSDKKLKTVKLNLKLNENKSQKNKFMSTGRPSGHNVSTRTQKSQHLMQNTSTQQGKLVNIGRRIIYHKSTHKDRTYYRSTPIKRTDWVSRHMNSNVSTHKNEKVWVRRHTEPTRSTYQHKVVQKSTPYKNSTLKS